MPLYYLIFDPVILEEQIQPALTASRRQRSFEPCVSIAAAFMPRAQAFWERYHVGPEEPVLGKLLHGLSFHRHLWQALASELLLFGAAAVILLCVAASALGVRKVMRLDPALVFK